MVLPTVMATPSPARHDAAFTMMSLLNVQRIEADNETAPESVSVGHPMSPPQIRGKRSRGAKTRMSQPPQVRHAAMWGAPCPWLPRALRWRVRLLVLTTPPMVVGVHRAGRAR